MTAAVETIDMAFFKQTPARELSRTPGAMQALRDVLESWWALDSTTRAAMSHGLPPHFKAAFGEMAICAAEQALDDEDAALIDLALEAATLANHPLKALVLSDYAAELIGYDAKVSADQLKALLTEHQNLKLLAYFSRRSGSAAYQDFIRDCHGGQSIYDAGDRRFAR